MTQLFAQLASNDLHYGHQEAALRLLRLKTETDERRIDELLQVGNEYLERARKAERELADARNVAKMAIIVAGEMAKQLPEVKL